MALPGTAPGGGTVTLTVNGTPVGFDRPGTVPLLSLLRNDLGLNGPKYGCGLGQCGACTVLVDGVPARACILPLAVARGRHVTTLEGLATAAGLHPVQQAFVDAQAAQCGYCLNGMIMTTVALLVRNPAPGEAETRRELSGNLCRCGAHVEILEAVRRASEAMRHAGRALRPSAPRDDGPNGGAEGNPPGPAPFAETDLLPGGETGPDRGPGGRSGARGRT